MLFLRKRTTPAAAGRTFKGNQQVMQRLTQVYIVLDALDGCTHRADLINLLTMIIRWRINNVHLLMTSQKEQEIESSLGSCITEKNTICLQRANVDDNIQRYVQESLFNNKKLAK